MATTEKTKITIETTVNAPVEKAWKVWSTPHHITKWCNASDDWHAPSATNDLKVGGRFTTRMEAKDKSMGFDFGGTYDKVETNKRLEYTIDDGRKVHVIFSTEGNQTKVVETFEAENENPVEMQRGGWQSILDNFKKYTESV